MTRDDFKKIVAVMKAVYTDPKFIPDQAAFNVWFDVLGDMDANTLMASVKKYMQTEKFPPFPADLRRMLQTNYRTPDEAWAIVSDSLWSVTSRKKADKVFNDLPEECQKTIGSAEALYAYTQGEWNESVNKALFTKNYKAIVERMQTESRMSVPLRTALAGGERRMIDAND